jgi:hypothetical protein
MARGDGAVMTAKAAMFQKAITDDVQAWADMINEAFDDAIQTMFELGRRFIAAKEALGHGQWLTMWKVERPVKFKSRMAQMYMKVGSHPELSKTQHVALLPRSIGALYELATLPSDVLSKALTDGAIRPTMERQAARKRYPYRPPPYPADGKAGYCTVIGPGPRRTVFLPGDGTCVEVDETEKAKFADAERSARSFAGLDDRVESEWFDSQGRRLPLMFRFLLETIQNVSKTIQMLTTEESLRAFARDDEIAEDLAWRRRTSCSRSTLLGSGLTPTTVCIAA